MVRGVDGVDGVACGTCDGSVIWPGKSRRQGGMGCTEEGGDEDRPRATSSGYGSDSPVGLQKPVARCIPDLTPGRQRYWRSRANLHEAHFPRGSPRQARTITIGRCATWGQGVAFRTPGIASKRRRRLQARHIPIDHGPELKLGRRSSLNMRLGFSSMWGKGENWAISPELKLGRAWPKPLKPLPTLASS
jgi:hypothetical protein